MRKHLILEIDKPCAVCGKSLRGKNINAKYCCKSCRNKARREQDKREQKERYLKRKMPKRCKFCGDIVTEKRMQICKRCKELRITYKPEEIRKMELKAPEPKEEETMKKKTNLSGRYSLEKLNALARKHNTSYGKIVCFLDTNGREPREGEMLL